MPSLDLQRPISVKTDSLEPSQRATAPRFQIACDFRQQWMIKHPFLSDFHSRSEHLHAGLLEGDPNVLVYVPQPFLLLIGNKRYIPDCFIRTVDGERLVIEIKPQGVMDEKAQLALQYFFEQHHMLFKVISNESILERKVEAENWLMITQILFLGRDFNTDTTEPEIYDQLSSGPLRLNEIIDPSDRQSTYLSELALFRLTHQGLARANLNQCYLDFNTEFELCTHPGANG